jgi:flagellin-like hook-associated protein FlgL
MSQTGRFLRSIDLSRTRLRASEEAIADAMDVVSEARAVAVQGGNTTNGPDARAALRVQVEQLFDQILDASNAKAPGGGFVFSGVASDVRAFERAGSFVSGSPPPTVSFEGDDRAIEGRDRRGGSPSRSPAAVRTSSRGASTSSRSWDGSGRASTRTTRR